VSDPSEQPALLPAPAVAQTSTWWSQVTEWKQAGVPRAEWQPRLVAAGLDDESARVVVNSVDGPEPTQLPDAAFAPRTNALSPGSFAFGEMGLQGNPATVGLYWLVFGVAVLAMLGAFALLIEFEVVEQPPDQLLFIARVMAPIALVALALGGWKVAGAVRVRRR
jgi:hypothetical protein